VGYPLGEGAGLCFGEGEGRVLGVDVDQRVFVATDAGGFEEEREEVDVGDGVAVACNC
jgi:hypothetical protein